MEQELPINNNKPKLTILKNFLSRKKKLLSVIISLLLILILSFFLFLELKKKKRAQISEKFNKITVDFKNNKNNTKVKKELINIVFSYDKTYSPLSLYFLIDNKIIVSRNEINNLFDELIKNTSLEKEVKNLVIYKKALFNSEFETENNLINQLNPLINSESIWKSHALYLLGEYFFFKKEKEKSKEFFERILNTKNANPEIKIEAQKRILRDLSE